MPNTPISCDFGLRWYYGGQFGNQLFHYVVAKIVAEKRGLDFRPLHYFFDKKELPVRWSVEAFFTQKPTPGKTFDGSKTFCFGGYNWYDFDSLPDNRALHCCYGWWCRYELLKDWKEKIRKDWLYIPNHKFVTTDPKAVYIHVRRTDIVPQQAEFQNQALTLEQYGKCLDAIGDYTKIVISTDDPKDSFHEGFWRFGVPVERLSGLWDQDFLTLASCRQLILSPSTYSWWAAFLGRPSKVILPVFKGTAWGKGFGAYGPDREQFPNLYVDDEPEKWIPVQ